jgi:hypothetical protein
MICSLDKRVTPVITAGQAVPATGGLVVVPGEPDTVTTDTRVPARELTWFECERSTTRDHGGADSTWSQPCPGRQKDVS